MIFSISGNLAIYCPPEFLQIPGKIGPTQHWNIAVFLCQRGNFPQLFSRPNIGRRARNVSLQPNRSSPAERSTVYSPAFPDTRNVSFPLRRWTESPVDTDANRQSYRNRLAGWRDPGDLWTFCSETKIKISKKFEFDRGLVVWSNLRSHHKKIVRFQVQMKNVSLVKTIDKI